MLTLLSMNWINIVLVAGLVLAVALIVAGRIRQKRAGKLPLRLRLRQLPHCAGCVLRTKENR